MANRWKEVSPDNAMAWNSSIMSLILGRTTLCDWCAAALTPLRRRSQTSLCFCVPSSLTFVMRPTLLR
eukprot:1910633-Amphidinium_carterae.1